MVVHLCHESCDSFSVRVYALRQRFGFGTNQLHNQINPVTFLNGEKVDEKMKSSKSSVDHDRSKSTNLKSCSTSLTYKSLWEWPRLDVPLAFHSLVHNIVFTIPRGEGCVSHTNKCVCFWWRHYASHNEKIFQKTWPEFIFLISYFKKIEIHLSKVSGS